MRTFFVAALLVVGMLAGCDDSSSSLTVNGTAIGSGGGSEPEAPMSVEVLESAASFLGAASGKETPLSVDSVVFINSVL